MLPFKTGIFMLNEESNLVVLVLQSSMLDELDIEVQ